MLSWCVFVLSTLGLSQSFLFHPPDQWNGLKVTWDVNVLSSRAFASMPRTETAAKAAGFTKLTDCGDVPNFIGKRYAKNGDTAVVLIFDTNGYIAGIQAGIPGALTNGYPQTPLKSHPFVLYQGKQYVTAYFVNPSTICSTGRTAAMFSHQGTGTELYIQNGTRPTDVLHIPKLQSDIANTKWVRGHCFPSMGVHYWYNVRKDMSCDEFFPVFLLYNHGKLNAFGWAFNADLTSTRFEHPPPVTFGAFLKPVPDCFKQQGRMSTLHIYMTSSPAQDICV